MRNSRGWIGIVAVFAVGVCVGAIWGRGAKVLPTLYEGKPAKDAGQALLDAAEAQAGGGSWELLGVGRVYYLSGDKAKGQRIFDLVIGTKPQKSDYERLAKVYLEAGEWAKAAPLLEKVLVLDPKDDSALAEAGAFYNLNGDRAKAESLFRQSFDRNPGNVWNTLAAAGSYLGVKPQ
jgi:tetratricopeptide (TPR) repeat protein